MYDVVIVGGGPAGLSAALVLGRCRRSVLLCDSGTPRNAAAQALHGYLTRDGAAPLELLRLGREELTRYAIDIRHAVVTGVQRGDAHFEVTIGQSDRVHARAVLLATGVRDELPPIPGLAECYGVSVHHCPYCDGWEHRDQSLAVIGHGAGAAGLSLSLKTWSDRVTLCTNGPPRLNPAQQRQLSARHVTVHAERVVRVEHEQRHVRRLLLDGGREVRCGGIFLSSTQAQQADFARLLGCEFTRKGTVKTDHLGETCVPGVYVVGDASRDVQFVIVAASEGAKAGVAINKALQQQAGLAVEAAS